MKLRKRVIGDLYLAASSIFIFLAFLYFTIIEKDDSFSYGISFLVIGLVIAGVGMVVKNIMIQKEKIESKPKKKLKAKKK